jgi:hypothetical protein
MSRARPRPATERSKSIPGTAANSRTAGVAGTVYQGDDFQGRLDSTARPRISSATRPERWLNETSPPTAAPWGGHMAQRRFGGQLGRSESRRCPENHLKVMPGAGHYRRGGALLRP